MRRLLLWGALLSGLVLCGGALWLLAPRTGVPDLPQDRALSRALPETGPLTLTVFGTSLTARYDWPERLVERLSACLGRRVALARVARPGASSAWALGQTARVTATAPDLVVMEFAINDADLRHRTGLGESRRRHRALLAALGGAEPAPAVLLLTMNPVTGLMHLSRPRLADYDAMVRDLAAEAGTGLVDLAPRWRADGAVLPDGVHPAEADAARIVVPPLAAAIAPAAGGACPA